MKLRPRDKAERPLTEDDNPPWTKLRFTGDTVLRCFHAARLYAEEIPELPLDAYEGIAAHVNAMMDRNHNESHGVYKTLNISAAKNVSLPKIRAELFARVLDAGGAMYKALEVYADYVPDQELFADIGELLLKRGMIASRKPAPPPRGRRRKHWRSNSKLIAGWVADALRGCGYADKLAADASSPVAAIGAAIVSRAYGVEIGPDSFAEGMKKQSRDRRKNPDRRPYFSD